MELVHERGMGPFAPFFSFTVGAWRVRGINIFGFF
jgi:hypothetical protein